MAEKVRDLRSALEQWKNMPGQLAETDVAVDPMAELAGVYLLCRRGRNGKTSDERRTGNDFPQYQRPPGRKCCDRCPGEPEACGCTFGL